MTYQKEQNDLIRNQALNLESSNIYEIYDQLMKHNFDHTYLTAICLLVFCHNNKFIFNLVIALKLIENLPMIIPTGKYDFIEAIGTSLAIIIKNLDSPNLDYYAEKNKYFNLTLKKIIMDEDNSCSRKKDFIALDTAIEFLNKALKLNLKSFEGYKCRYCINDINCIGTTCPFYCYKINDKFRKKE